ncbi:MAG: thiol reductant ABC exporter subunit CydD [Anaerolineae bacterium]|nr:thiol reductant ABC exporter subunit CydD [Anaerolineae bacterium]
MNLDRRLFGEARAVRAALALTALVGLVSAGLTVAGAALLSAVISGVLLRGEGLDQAAGALAALLAVAVGRAIFTWIGGAAAHHVGEHVKRDLRERLAAHLLALGPAYTRAERSGELAASAVEGVEALDAYFTQYLPQLFQAAIIPLTILVLVFAIDLVSGLVLLVTAPLIPFFMVLIGKAAGGLARRQYGTLSRLSAHFLDVLQGLPTLKMFGRSRAQIAAVERISDQFRRATLDVLRVAFLSALALEMLATLSTAIIAVQIGLRLLAGVLHFEQAFFVLVLAPEYYLPLRMLGARFHSGVAGIGAAERIFAVLERPTPTRAVQVTASPLPAPPVRLDVRFEDVHFRYPNAERPALDGVSFVLSAGTRTALVGPSGAGKSTIFQLLLGFLQPSSGRILVNGAPLDGLPPDAWRAHVAWVAQSPYLFHGSVADNLRLARPDATPDDLVEAARQANAHSFIAALPQGYDTPIGERGARLSGGQAQRLALARAFLRPASLLLFDEATSNLDPENERLIGDALMRLVRKRTVFVIAHRLHTVADADQIIALDGGRVAQTGRHADLVRADGVYRALVATAGA